MSKLRAREAKKEARQAATERGAVERCVVQCCKNTFFSPCPEVLDPVQASLPTV